MIFRDFKPKIKNHLKIGEKALSKIGIYNFKLENKD